MRINKKTVGIFCFVLGLLAVIAGVFASPIQFAINVHQSGGYIGIIGGTLENTKHLLWLHFSSYFWLRLIGCELTVFGAVLLIVYKKLKKNT